jgi:hypothetical protein
MIPTSGAAIKVSLTLAPGTTRTRGIKLALILTGPLSYFGDLTPDKTWHESCFSIIELRVKNSTKVHKNSLG